MKKDEKKAVLDLIDKTIEFLKYKHAVPEYEKTLTYKNEVKKLNHAFRSFALFKILH